MPPSSPINDDPIIHDAHRNDLLFNDSILTKTTDKEPDDIFPPTDDKLPNHDDSALATISDDLQQQHHLSITPPITPSHAQTFAMDISKIYTQNAHGLWCRARDGDGNIIVNYERDTAKLEHLVYRMRVDDIDAWLVQETWLEEDDFSTNIGGYHLFRHNSPIGITGHDNLFCGVAIILSPRYFLVWKAAGSPPPIMTGSAGEYVGRFIGLTLKFDCFDSLGR